MKQAIIERICEILRQKLDVLARAAMEAHLAATDPGSKAEGKYDTRSLEASYLASGQARQVDDLAEALRIFEAWALPDFGVSDEVDAGALVDVEIQGSQCAFLLAPAAGGMELTVGAREITVLTPESPLYQKLCGLMVGDELDQPRMRVLGLL